MPLNALFEHLDVWQFLVLTNSITYLHILNRVVPYYRVSGELNWTSNFILYFIAVPRLQYNPYTTMIAHLVSENPAYRLCHYKYTTCRPYDSKLNQYQRLYQSVQFIIHQIQYFHFFNNIFPSYSDASQVPYS